MLRLVAVLVGLVAEAARWFPLVHVEHVGDVINHLCPAHSDAQDGETADDEAAGCDCGEEHDQDRPLPGERWIVTPTALRRWLQMVEDGEVTTDDVMIQLELLEIGTE